ncbi:MAG: tolQ: protein TolQ [Firmicutes bacterium]|nr:tolQ: protein TolQ [Bacillota bacterium]
MELINQTIHLFYQGGPIMYIMAACSFFAVAIAVERLLYFRNITRNLPEFQQEFKPLLEKGRFLEATKLCEQTSPNVLAGIAIAGLQAFQQGSKLETALESAASLAAARMRERLDDLSMIVTLSPLLGLLGTVIGMIQSFSVLQVQTGQPMAITGGVGEALVATATGLSIATLALLLHNTFSRKVNRLITEIEQTAAFVVSNVSVKKTGRRDSHEIA